VERFILRCVALRQLSTALPVRVWLEHGSCRLLVFFSFCYDCARPIWADAPCNFSSAAPLFVFLYCILERSLINMLSTTFSGPTHHKLTFIHLRQGSLDKCSCPMDLEHVFLHHNYTIPSLNNPHPSQPPTERVSLTKPAVACMLKSASQVGACSGQLQEEPKLGLLASCGWG